MKDLFRSALGAFLVVALFSTVQATDDDKKPGVVYEIDVAHSQIAFKVRHLGISTVKGNFKTFDATLSVGDDPTTLETTATIAATSVDTGVDRRDNHLRSPDFFEVEKYPEITFKSTGIKNVDGGNFTLVGDLTIRGVTKAVELDAEMRGPATLMKKQRVGFSASGKINRTDYGLTWNRAIETGGFVVGEEVTLEIEVEAIAAEDAE